MAITFQAQATLAADPIFIGRVQQAAITTAQAVYTEGTGVAGHTARAAFAVSVLRSPASYGPTLAAGVAALASVSPPLDPEISNSLSAIWNDYAAA